MQSEEWMIGLDFPTVSPILLLQGHLEAGHVFQRTGERKSGRYSSSTTPDEAPELSVKLTINGSLTAVVFHNPLHFGFRYILKPFKNTEEIKTTLI